MKLLRGMINSISDLFSIDQLRSGRNIPLFLPFYHLVSDRESAFRSNYNYPSVERFEEDLDFILQHFNPVSLKDLIEGRFTNKSFHLSFDDGLRQCYDIVFPILKKKGVSATFFLNPAFVDNKDIFHRYKASILKDYLQKKSTFIDIQQTYADIASIDQLAEDIGFDWNFYLEKEKPYMSLEQVKEMQNEGFSFGAHSWDHPEFWLLDASTQVSEIENSMQWINENLKPEIRTFAFPFTDFGVPDEVFAEIREKKICDISFGTAGIKLELQSNHFQRLPMEQESFNNAEQIIKSEYLSYKFKKGIKKHVAKR